MRKAKEWEVMDYEPTVPGAELYGYVRSGGYLRAIEKLPRWNEFSPKYALIVGGRPVAIADSLKEMRAFARFNFHGPKI